MVRKRVLWTFFGVPVSRQQVTGFELCRNRVGVDTRVGTVSAPGWVCKREGSRGEGNEERGKKTADRETAAHRMIVLAMGPKNSGSTARLHSKDDANSRVSVSLRQQLCVSACESPLAHPAFEFCFAFVSFAKGSSRADRPLRGAYGGRVQPDSCSTFLVMKTIQCVRGGQGAGSSS